MVAQGSSEETSQQAHHDPVDDKKTSNNSEDPTPEETKEPEHVANIFDLIRNGDIVSRNSDHELTMEEQEEVLSMVRNGEIFGYIHGLKTTIRTLEAEKTQIQRECEEKRRDVPDQAHADADVVLPAGEKQYQEEKIEGETKENEEEDAASSMEIIKKERDALRLQCQEHLATIANLKNFKINEETTNEKHKNKDAAGISIVSQDQENNQLHNQDHKEHKEVEQYASSSITDASEDEEMEIPTNSFDQPLPESILCIDGDEVVVFLKDENLKLKAQAGQLLAIMEEQNLKHQGMRKAARKHERQNESFRKRIAELKDDIQILKQSCREKEESLKMTQRTCKSREAEVYKTVHKMSLKLGEYEDDKERLLAKCTALEYLVAAAKKQQQQQ